MKRVVCFCIPEPLAWGYKTHNEFHKYRMKWKFISEFQILFITCWTRKNARKTQFYRVLCLILLRKTRQRRGRYLRRHRRTATSKPIKLLLCAMSKLIYEIAIFHSINRETCDKYQCRIQQNCNVRLTYTYVKLPYKTYVKRTNWASSV